MKIIILGAGQVGATLAENLAGEENEITLVDIDSETGCMGAGSGEGGMGDDTVNQHPGDVTLHKHAKTVPANQVPTCGLGDGMAQTRALHLNMTF